MLIKVYSWKLDNNELKFYGKTINKTPIIGVVFTKRLYKLGLNFDIICSEGSFFKLNNIRPYYYIVIKDFILELNDGNFIKITVREENVKPFDPKIDNIKFTKLFFQIYNKKLKIIIFKGNEIITHVLGSYKNLSVINKFKEILNDKNITNVEYDLESYKTLQNYFNGCEYLILEGKECYPILKNFYDTEYICNLSYMRYMTLYFLKEEEVKFLIEKFNLKKFSIQNN
jgi:hypothetical protein